MIEKIKKIFNIQTILFVVSILIVSITVFFWIYVTEINKQHRLEFESELSILANDIRYTTLIAEENVKALSSRTMIRKELYSYVKGTVSLNEVREYTGNKYTDGASVYEGIISARRISLNGKTIAAYTRNDLTAPDFSPQKLAYFKEDGKYYIYIKNEINHNGMMIGYDTAVFHLDILDGRNDQYIESLFIGVENSVNRQYESINHKGTHKIPVGSGYYAAAVMRKQNFFDNKMRDMLMYVTVQGLVLIAAVYLISYFTILKLVYTLTEKLDAANSSLLEAVKSKEMLLRELHHRVKNNLNIIISYINIQSSESNNYDLLERNNELIGRIHAIKKVHEILQNASDFAKLEIGPYLEDLCRQIIDSSGMKNISLKSTSYDRIVFRSKTAIDMGLVFTELIMNSIKHAIDEEELLVTIEIFSDNNDCVLTYTDNGRPYPEDFNQEKSTSLGLVIIQSIVKSHNGKISVDRSKKETRITLPLKKEE